jgi:hypothetical protein
LSFLWQWDLLINCTPSLLPEFSQKDNICKTSYFREVTFILPLVYRRFSWNTYPPLTRINDGDSRFLYNIATFLPDYLHYIQENTNYYKQLRGNCKCLAIWQKVHVQLARFFVTKELNCKILWNVNFGGSE